MKRLHKHDFNTKSYLPQSILTTTIFNSVSKNNFNNKVLYTYENKNYKIEVNGYQPNLDIDFKIFCFFVSLNKDNSKINIDDLIKLLGHDKRIQKRDRERVLKSIDRMMQTWFKIEYNNKIININLISSSVYDKNTKELSVNFDKLFDLYINEKFFKFISINDLLELNQYETAVYLLIANQTNKLIIKEEQIKERLFINTNINDYDQSKIIKNVLNSLQDKKYIRSYSLNDSNIYTIIREKTKGEKLYKELQQYMDKQEVKKVMDPFQTYKNSKDYNDNK